MLNPSKRSIEFGKENSSAQPETNSDQKHANTKGGGPDLVEFELESFD